VEQDNKKRWFAVRYFEDGSVSVCPASALRRFDPQREPYTAYEMRIEGFEMDPAVQHALNYLKTGLLPKHWFTQEELRAFGHEE
jgi:hypothetical protein